MNSWSRYVPSGICRECGGEGYYETVMEMPLATAVSVDCPHCGAKYMVWQRWSGGDDDGHAPDTVPVAPVMG